MALFAMLTGIAMPAHAYRSHGPTDLPGADFCTTVKPAGGADAKPAQPIANAPSTPAAGHAVQCDTCCGCSGTAAVPALPRSSLLPASTPAPKTNAPAAHPSAVPGFALARGPPATA